MPKNVETFACSEADFGAGAGRAPARLGARAARPNGKKSARAQRARIFGPPHSISHAPRRCTRQAV